MLWNLFSRIRNRLPRLDPVKKNQIGRWLPPGLVFYCRDAPGMDSDGRRAGDRPSAFSVFSNGLLKRSLARGEQSPKKVTTSQRTADREPKYRSDLMKKFVRWSNNWFGLTEFRREWLKIEKLWRPVSLSHFFLIILPRLVWDVVHLAK